MARRPEYLRPRVPDGTEVVGGDVFDRESLVRALEGVDTAYYLIHSMASGRSFEEQDRKGASNFAAAARSARVRRVVYLGGLGGDEELSEHLESRQEVGRILRESGVPTIEFRAGIIIGSGSLSFALVRALVEKLPVMITPRWVSTPTQPIAVEDVIAYLVSALGHDVEGSAIYEIGGPDRVSYLGLMREYARQRGLRRMFIRVPLLTPRLSSLWLGLVTPLYARVGRALIDGLRNETVVREDRALRDFDIRPRTVSAAIARALSNEDSNFAATRWSDAASASWRPQWGGAKFGSRIVDSCAARIDCRAADAFRPIRRIGGQRGWYYANWAWRLRGFLDLLVGGAGMRRGRRDAEHLLPGDTLDFWRVERIEPNRLLRLQAEMKLPGRAWMQFEVDEDGQGCTVRQTALFDPLGLSGLLYWYALYPAHKLMCRGLLRRIVEHAKRDSVASARQDTDSGRSAGAPTRPGGAAGGASEG
jgi:uncharacterized protein YbjT (DUF2867 family)